MSDSKCYMSSLTHQPPHTEKDMSCGEYEGYVSVDGSGVRTLAYTISDAAAKVQSQKCCLAKCCCLNGGGKRCCTSRTRQTCCIPKKGDKPADCADDLATNKRMSRSVYETQAFLSPQCKLEEQQVSADNLTTNKRAGRSVHETQVLSTPQCTPEDQQVYFDYYSRYWAKMRRKRDQAANSSDKPTVNNSVVRTATKQESRVNGSIKHDSVSPFSNHLDLPFVPEYGSIQNCLLRTPILLQQPQQPTETPKFTAVHQPANTAVADQSPAFVAFPASAPQKRGPSLVSKSMPGQTSNAYTVTLPHTDPLVMSRCPRPATPHSVAQCAPSTSPLDEVERRPAIGAPSGPPVPSQDSLTPRLLVDLAIPQPLGDSESRMGRVGICSPTTPSFGQLMLPSVTVCHDAPSECEPRSPAPEVLVTSPVSRSCTVVSRSSTRQAPEVKVLSTLLSNNTYDCLSPYSLKGNSIGQSGATGETAMADGGSLYDKAPVTQTTVVGGGQWYDRPTVTQRSTADGGQCYESSPMTQTVTPDGGELYDKSPITQTSQHQHVNVPFYTATSHTATSNIYGRFLNPPTHVGAEAHSQRSQQSPSEQYNRIRAYVLQQGHHFSTYGGIIKPSCQRCRQPISNVVTGIPLHEWNRGKGFPWNVATCPTCHRGITLCTLCCQPLPNPCPECLRYFTDEDEPSRPHDPCSSPMEGRSGHARAVVPDANNDIMGDTKQRELDAESDTAKCCASDKSGVPPHKFFFVGNDPKHVVPENGKTYPCQTTSYGAWPRVEYDMFMSDDAEIKFRKAPGLFC